MARRYTPYRSYGPGDPYVRAYGQEPIAIPQPAGPAGRGRIHRARTVGTILQGSDPTDLPTGTDYVRYQDLYVTGDSVTGALARLSSPKYVTFPEGEFADSDFTSDSSKPGYYQACITIPRQCRGIIGSGSGTLGGSTGTVFSIKPRTSTAVAKGLIPAQGTSKEVQCNILKHYALYAPTYRNFQVRGTDQGHIFNGMQSFNTPSNGLVKNVSIFGWEGDAGAPPGETYALGMNGGTGHLLEDMEVDGRRTLGGQVFGAMGLTFQSNAGNLFNRCNLHHMRAAGAVFYKSFDSELRDCTIDSLSAGSYALGNGGVNIERSDGIVLTRPKLVGRIGKVHITLSNDYVTLNLDGKTYSAAGGSLEIVDPIYNDNLGNGYLSVQTWIPYVVGPSTVVGNSMTYPGAVGPDGKSANGPSCAPWMHKADGTRLTYLWIFDKRYVNPIPHARLVP